MAHPWPGNVRELKNVIESMVVVDFDGILDIDDLPEDLTSPGSDDLGQTMGHTGSATGVGGNLVGQSLEDVEKHFIAETLKLTGGNREETARMLGIGERTLYRKIKEYGLG